MFGDLKSLSDEALLRHYSKEGFKFSICYAILHLDKMKKMTPRTVREKPKERKERLAQVSRVADRHLNRFRSISEEIRRRLAAGASAAAKDPEPQPRPGSAYDLPAFALARMGLRRKP